MPPPADAVPPLDAWLGELGLTTLGGTEAPDGAAFSRDLVLDGERRFDLRVTVAWVAGLGLHLWAYYGQEAMELPRRILARLLYANAEYPMVKFAVDDDDRPMLMTELPSSAVDREELGRGLTRLLIVADRLLDETARAVADRGELPDWSGRIGRNPDLLARYRAEVESALPPWEPAPTASRRPARRMRLFGWRRP